MKANPVPPPALGARGAPGKRLRGLRCLRCSGGVAPTQLTCQTAALAGTRLADESRLTRQTRRVKTASTRVFRPTGRSVVAGLILGRPRTRVRLGQVRRHFDQRPTPHCPATHCTLSPWQSLAPRQTRAEIIKQASSSTRGKADWKMKTWKAVQLRARQLNAHAQRGRVGPWGGVVQSPFREFLLKVGYKAQNPF